MEYTENIIYFPYILTLTIAKSNFHTIGPVDRSHTRQENDHHNGSSSGRQSASND
jgi:hypothetical protein